MKKGYIVLMGADFNYLFQDKFISDYLQKNRGIIVPSVSRSLNSILFINLQQLPRTPVNFPEILLRWIIFVNRKRIENNEEIIITYEIIKSCPIWKVIEMPIKNLSLTKESLNKSKGPVPSRKTNKIGSINKKSK